MAVRIWHILERLTCTCWLYNRSETAWRIPLWPGRDRDGYLAHSLGSELYRLECWVSCKAWDAEKRAEGGA